MSSLFRSLNHFSSKRENVVKEALINTLNENAREIEFEVKQKSLEVLGICEQTSALCTTLEALFLHGLKDSFLSATFNVIAGDVERRPEPSFWSPCMVFMHKQVIEQVLGLSQITSETGQCRAWVRQSLNESVFSSYLNNMRKNGSALSQYYKRNALIRDSEGLETAAKIMESLEAYVQFDLPVNSSLLNHWPDYSLQLSDLWTPALKSCPISSGVDVASSLGSDIIAIPTPQPLQTNELFSESISNSPFGRNSNFGVPELSQRENLDLLIQKFDEMDVINEEQTGGDKAGVNETAEQEAPSGSKARSRKNSKRQIDSSSFADLDLEAPSLLPQGSNSLSNLMQTSWSGDLEATPTSPTEELTGSRFFQRSVSVSSAVSLRSPTTDRCSYNALLRKHESNRESGAGWSEIWEKFRASASNLNVAQPQRDTDPPISEDLSDLQSLDTYSEFELLTSEFDMVELQQMVAQLCQLAREPGLDAQGFLCKSCQHPLGIGYSNFQVCAFSGSYYCNSCMDVEMQLIPARIIYNWDFRKYSVSKRAATFLAEFRSHPFLDMQLLNPRIYFASDAMAELQSLRIRLNFIRAYLYTCAPSSIELLQNQFAGREYLYEHIHLYSIADLALIQRGVLCQQLQKAFKLGEAHVLKCRLCHLKGFICEICQSPRVLYPFHISTTFRCLACGAVFHAECLNEKQPCPKCERIRKREDQGLQEAVQCLKQKNDVA
ncbi:uncharacterized protein LOC117135904 [Drosophila mauritiana]|uniref:Uncharacterized protein LOC117135904 n=1 Tax=Drosophila mauritiana TaxID=7226 RepID=A0A6P8J979_DROMA|nr:uncharacterized protein LOC117135904 [Drosophila mauritiana]